MLRSAFVAVLSAFLLVSSHSTAQTAGTGAVTVSLSAGANPTAAGVSLTSMVQPVAGATGTELPHPGGSVTFFDGTTALNAAPTPVADSAAYASTTFAQSFGTPDPALTANGSRPAGVSGDFNEDGSPDLLLYGFNSFTTSSAQVQVFASIPGGKFVVLPLQNLALPTSGVLPTVAVLDVNGDGHLDLLFNGQVAYGKGDGTFANPVALPLLANGFSQSYAADVTGDGKLDIIAVNTPPNATTATYPVQFTFTVFRNDGSGTFTSLGAFPLAAPLSPPPAYDQFNIFGLSFADLNGDGKLDVLSQSNGVPPVNAAQAPNLYTMLSNGDGTFAAPRMVDTSTTLSLSPFPTAFADMNGDGKLDMVLAYSPTTGGNYVTIFPGQGDGTFGPASSVLLDLPLSPPAEVQSLTVLDVNFDGHPDVVTGLGAVALADGSGGLTASTPLFPESEDAYGSPVAYPLLSEAFSSNSQPSLIFLNLKAGANAVFTPQNNSSANASVVLGAGTHTLIAHYSGDSVYAATVSPAVTVTVAQAATSVSLTSSANPSYAGGNVTFTAKIAGLAPGATGTVSFSNGSTALGTSIVSKGIASFTTSFPTAGNQAITAAYSGDANDATSSGTVDQAVEAPVGVGGGGSGTTSLTVASGQSTTTTVSATAAAGFSGMVSFSCTGLPTNASCTFSPSSVSVSGTAAATTSLTVSTLAAATASAGEGALFAPGIVLACGLPLLGLLGIAPLRRGGRLLMLVCALLICGGAAIGCGGNSSTPAQTSQSKTPAGSYTFQVVAAAGASQSTANYTLIVQ